MRWVQIRTTTVAGETHSDAHSLRDRVCWYFELCFAVQVCVSFDVSAQPYENESHILELCKAQLMNSAVEPSLAGPQSKLPWQSDGRIRVQTQTHTHTYAHTSGSATA